MKNRRPRLGSLLFPLLILCCLPARAQTKKSCEKLRQEMTDARKEYEEAKLSGRQGDIDAAKRELDAARQRWHDCADKTPTATGGGKKSPPCAYEHEWVEDRQKAWNDKFFKTGQDDGALKQKWMESLKEYCRCLAREGVNPLPDECNEPAVREVAPPAPAKRDSTPPPPPKASAPPPAPPTKSATPPPPPPVVAPPPPRAATPPPPSNTSTYVCGKAVCDCAKQSPPKVCKAASGCACTKG